MSDLIFLGDETSDLASGKQYAEFTKVILNFDTSEQDGQYVEAGEDGGAVMDVPLLAVTNSAYAQEIAENILEQLQGLIYQPYAAAEAMIDPAFELGDWVETGDVVGVIGEADELCDALYSADISAKSDGETDDEFIYQPSSERNVDRKIARTSASLKVEIDNVTAQVTEEAGAWQPDTEYFPGVIVIHGGKKYVCTEQHTSGDTFDADKWEETDKDRYYAFLKLKSDGLHIGNDDGETYINGASIKTGTIKTSQIVVDGSISFTGGLNDALEESKNPDYIKDTYIDHTKIVAPNVVGGEMFATGQGDSAGSNPAFYVCDGTTGTGGALAPNAPKGWLCYDKNGVEPDEAKNRVFLHSEPDVALKIEAGGNMSIEAGGSVFLESGLVLYDNVHYGTTLPSALTVPSGTLFFIVS